MASRSLLLVVETLLLGWDDAPTYRNVDHMSSYNICFFHVVDAIDSAWKSMCFPNHLRGMSHFREGCACIDESFHMKKNRVYMVGLISIKSAETLIFLLIQWRKWKLNREIYFIWYYSKYSGIKLEYFIFYPRFSNEAFLCQILYVSLT